MIFWGMIGYPMTLLLLGKTKLSKRPFYQKKEDYLPTVTVLIVAHNEETVILDKLKNVCTLDYPKEQLEIVVASDHSTDKTNVIVERFIQEHGGKRRIRIVKSQQRGGKTNAQNEAVQTIQSEIIVFTDANAMIDTHALKKIVDPFQEPSISYTTGQLVYINKERSATSASEDSYWSLDTKIREIEGRIQTITAGNGALYACRKSEYIEFPPIESHDSSMPRAFALKKQRAIAVSDAFVYEKAGETSEDEFQRKVRMNRVIIQSIMATKETSNLFKYGWYSFFYFGHRTSRYLLWFNHLLFLITSLILFKTSLFFEVMTYVQLIFYILAIIPIVLPIRQHKLCLPYYYMLTIWAQAVGIYRVLRKQSKPVWESAKTTR